MNTNDGQPKTPELIPWAGRDNSGDAASNIVGNRAGLLLIRSAIDAALENRQACIDESEIEFTGVHLVDQAPKDQAASASDQWLVAGCLLLAVTAFVIFLYGLVKLFEALF